MTENTSNSAGGVLGIDQADSKGRTTLMYAADNGDEKLVEKLLSTGADINLSDDKSHSALSLAIINRHETICRQLLS